VGSVSARVHGAAPYRVAARIVPLDKALEYVRGLPCWHGDDLDHVLGETPRKLFGF
jgi:hypothetical protein